MALVAVVVVFEETVADGCVVVAVAVVVVVAVIAVVTVNVAGVMAVGIDCCYFHAYRCCCLLYVCIMYV